MYTHLQVLLISLTFFIAVSLGYIGIIMAGQNVGKATIGYALAAIGVFGGAYTICAISWW